MSIGKFFRKQLAAVISWDDQDPDLLLYKYPAPNDEIKNASKLIIAPGQAAILVYEGKMTDEIREPGIYDLETDNHPFITSLLKLRTALRSEHLMQIYFYRAAEVVDQGWGTAQAIKYVDPVYGFPIELGANGSFSFSIKNAAHLYQEVIGSRNHYTTEEARHLLQRRFPPAISAVLSAQKISYDDIDAELPRLGELIMEQLKAETNRLGLELRDFKVNGTLFDAKTMERIGRVSDIAADSVAAQKAGLSYVELEKLRALRDAARNEGGLAGAGMQMGVGMELGKTFHEQKEQQVDAAAADTFTKIQQLKLLLSEGMITQEEFDTKKNELLSKI